MEIKMSIFDNDDYFPKTFSDLVDIIAHRDLVYKNQYKEPQQKSCCKTSRGYNLSVTIKDDTLFVTLDMPGIKKDQLQIVQKPGNVLSITGKNVSRNYVSELPFAKNWDLGKTTAHFEDGVLSLTIGAKEEHKAIDRVIPLS